MAGFGIDFGTTTSAAVQLLGGRPLTMGDEEGLPLPSIVAIDRATGEAFGGRDAWNRRFELSEHGNYWVIPSIKPLLASDRQWPTNRGVWWPSTPPLYSSSWLESAATKAAPISSATVAVPVGMSAESRRQIRRRRRLSPELRSRRSSPSRRPQCSGGTRISSPPPCRGVRLGWWYVGRQRRRVSARGHFRDRARRHGFSGNALDHEIALFLHSRVMESAAMVAGSRKWILTIRMNCCSGPRRRNAV